MKDADKERERKAAIEAHATYGSGPANGPSPEQSLANMRDALPSCSRDPFQKHPDHDILEFLPEPFQGDKKILRRYKLIYNTAKKMIQELLYTDYIRVNLHH